MKRILKTFNATVAATALVASSIFSVPAFAASQGILDTTSTGSVDMSVTVTRLARITHLADITLGTYIRGTGNESLNSPACVYTNTTNGSYKITATGDGASSAYTLASGSNTIAYTVVWNSGGGGSLADSGTTLATGVLSATLTNADIASQSCATAGDTAQLNIHITGAILDAAVAGTYTGTLTLLVTPI